MKAILADPPGGPEALCVVELPVPQPGEGEVLIHVQAAGINRADILQRQGKYDPPKGASNILGMEAAGEIVALGKNVRRWKAGDKVAALLAGGGYAEYVAVPEGQCLPWPKGFNALQAGTTPEATFTVWANIFQAGRLASGETALIHGGSSGIGTFAIQMVKAAGASAIVTVGNDEKAQACIKLGAVYAINYKTQDFVQEVLAATNGRGVDVVLDMVGVDYVSKNIEALAPFGRHISIGTQRGTRAEIDIRRIMQKQIVLTGSTMRGRDVQEKCRLACEVEAKAWPWLEKGLVKPVIFQSFPMHQAAEAHKVMESSAHIGKIALTFR